MNQPSNLMLSETDRLILRSYCQMLDGLSHYLGDSYELVLHSLEDYNHSAIKVINGFHTGRTEGAPITDFSALPGNRCHKGHPPANHSP